jgi:TrbB protein
MHNKDVIRLFGHAMLIEFAATGETGSITTLRLDQGIRFANAGQAIEVYYRDAAKPAIIEWFASDALALAAHRRLQAAVRRYVLLRRAQNFGKKLILWGAVPPIALVLALALNVATTRGPAAAGTGLTAMLANTAPPQQVSGPPNPAPPAAELARAMADGVKAGKFSVRLSQGKKGALYVFSDPSCTHCRKLEPELDKLGAAFSVHVFPVSVVGGSQSAARASQILCAQPQSRAANWKDALGGGSTAGRGCPAGDAALAANDQIFRVMGFSGTPTIISAAGDTVPDSIPNTAAAISQWLAESHPAN